jgi:quercetin dioxygenase-like cupin family protein
MKVKSPATSLKFELTNQIRAMHSARDDVYIQVPDIKKEDMIPWSMEQTWFYPLCLDCESNQMTLLFVMDKGIGIHAHYHCGQTFAYTLQGRWRYVEAEDKVMVPGTFILEFPGVMHTVEVLSDEPVYMLANIRSGFLFVEKERDYYGTLKMYQDPYYFYLRAKQYYQEMAKDFRKIEEVTVLGSPIRTLGA